MSYLTVHLGQRLLYPAYQAFVLIVSRLLATPLIWGRETPPTGLVPPTGGCYTRFPPCRGGALSEEEGQVLAESLMVRMPLSVAWDFRSSPHLGCH
jgi:hypothetical protein